MVVKEHYLKVKMVLNKLGYSEHNWAICVYFRMVIFCWDSTEGTLSKYPCFLCYWESRASTRHWVNKNWPAQEDLSVGYKNIIHKPLVSRDRIILPPLHIKLGLMKQFVKTLDKHGDGDCYNYIVKNFPGLSMEKMKAGIFDGPQIRKLIQDQASTSHMTTVESAARCSYVSVVREFLGNTTVSN